jgi:membrane protease YdiL (CAAX protease family)
VNAVTTNDMEDSDPDSLPTPRRLVLMAVVFYFVVGGLAVLLGWWWGCPPGAAIELDGRHAAWGLAAALPVAAAMWAVLELPLGPFLRIRRLTDELLVPLFRECRPLELLVIAVLAGVAEEMLFRGVVQQAVAGLWDAPAGAWIGLAVAAVLFGLMHPFTPTYVLLAAAIGAYLGWLWMATGNLLVPITAHAAYDFLALVYLVKFHKPEGGTGERGNGGAGE